MGLVFSNFGKATVASAPSGASGLSFSVTAGQGSLFPNLGAGDYFYGIFKDSSGNREIVKIMARSADAMTIAARGIDGTTARTWAAGDYFVAGLTNAALQELWNQNLVALGGLASAADKLPYFTGSGTAALTTLSAFIRTLLDDADAVAARATLGAAGLSGNETIAGTKTFSSGPVVPTAVVDTNTTQAASTAFVLAQAGSATPLVDAATAVVGTSTRYARADHVHPQRNIASGTVQATTSGTSKDFTGIPSWAKKITVILSGVSTNGTDPVLIQIGDSGGIETTGYASTYCSIDNSTTLYTEGSTIGFIIPGIPAVAIRSGILTLTLIDASTNTWVASGSFKTSTTVAGYTGGDKSLSATLDRVRLTTSNGVNTFDAGQINILYE